MHIVLEGPDGSGKSTLAGELARLMNLPIVLGKGPPRGPGEINERIALYIKQGRVIFDRHPAVSQMMYGSLRNDSEMPDPSLIKLFYATKPMFVYCRTTDGVKDHIVKPHEDPAHIEMLTENYDKLVRMYDEWALKAARFIYRIGDDVVELANMLGQMR